MVWVLVAAIAFSAPRVPAYVSPEESAKELGIPKGPIPEIRDGGLWFGPEAVRYLKHGITSAEPQSDARAARAWAWGVEDGVEKSKDLLADTVKRAEDAENAKWYWLMGGALGGVVVGSLLK